jgi:apolipoprotein N-acyltransferase
VTSSASIHPDRASFIQSIGEPVILAWGWRRRLIALVAGATGALALAPINFWPAMLAPLCAAVWLIDGSADINARGGTLLPSMRSAFWVGWWWGFGYFVAGLWWLGSAFLVEADQFAWALPLGVLALPAGLAFFPALGFAIARALWSAGPARALALAVGLGASEWLRALILTGFPWNELGMALGGTLVLAEAASWIGLHGLTFATIAIFAAPATLIDEARGVRRAAPTVVGLVALVFLAAFGAWRLSAPEAATVAGVKLRIMQPNLAPDQKFIPANREEIVSRYLALSDKATSPERSGVADVTHLFWPESAFPFMLTREPEMLARISAFLGNKTTLISGAIRAQEPLPGEYGARYFNSIFVIGKGTLLDFADKVHLVPFGEYLPLQDFFDRLGLRQLVRVPGGFTPGLEHKTLKIPGLADAAPLICYEAVFPGEAVPQGAGRFGLMVNVTNDAWYGQTSGPYQHLAQARLRSIEQGLPLVRAANTGISAVIDPYGRVVASLPLGVEAVLDSELPRAISPPLYAKLGDGPFFAMMLSLMIAGFVLRSRRSLSRA